MNTRIGVVIVAAALALMPVGSTFAKSERVAKSQSNAFSLFITNLLKPAASPTAKTSAPTVAAKAAAACDLSVPAHLRNCDVGAPTRPQSGICLNGECPQEPCVGRECGMEPPDGGDI
jgi:hypothetical protein